LLTLLSGRTLPVVLYPFDFPEYAEARGLHASTLREFLRKRNKLRKLCDDYLVEGGFPEVVLTDNGRLKKEILANYAKNILYQDIVPRFELKRPYLVERLFFYLVSNVGSFFTFNNLAKIVGISDKTAKDYIDFFRDAFLLYSVGQYNSSVKKQLRSPRKIYCTDNGMIASVSFSFSANVDRYLENMVFCKLLQQGREIYYYKTSNGWEVDFFCPGANREARLVQVCADLENPKTREREIRALCRAAEELNLEGGIIVTRDEEDSVTAGGKTVTMIPVWKYLAGVPSGRNPSPFEKGD